MWHWFWLQAEKEGIGCVEKRGMIMEFVVAWPEFANKRLEFLLDEVEVGNY
jgi:hypothetical protein